MYRPHPVIHPGAALKVTIGAAHAESVALGASVVMLCATSDCHIVFGSDPAATANDTLLPAKVPVVFACLPTEKVSVIQDSTTGTLFIAPAQ
jgi:hypothetical protein